MQKHEWRKSERAIYLPKNKPDIIDLPEFQFITIHGEGNPNTDVFSDCISVLYALSYGIKMKLKKVEDVPVDYCDYTVYPLEGVWDINEKAKKNATGIINKNDFVYTLMIRQPNFVSLAFFSETLEHVKIKKPHPFLDHLRFEKITEGQCIQMLHIGSYDNEPASFSQMEVFAKENGLKRISKTHREIYLSDFRKVPAEKLKTVLRFQVK